MAYKAYDPEIAARKRRNVEIFEETLKICRKGFYVSPAGARIELPPMDEVLAASEFYRNPPKVDDIPTCVVSTVDVVNADCIDAARELVEGGYKPIVLNMADRHTPGGGVLSGARAQEETLFRRSNLCVSLYRYDEYHASLIGVEPADDGCYPMDRNTGGIYSGRVMFFRAGVKEEDALLENPFECAVVSVAAINRPDLDADGRLVNWAIAATKQKIRTMLRIGLIHGHDAIVLSAWGCGAFRNPPEHMAELFDDVLHEPEFANKYRCVRFAIIGDHNSRHSNYAPFDRRFNGKKNRSHKEELTASGGIASPREMSNEVGFSQLERSAVNKDRVKGMLWGLIVGDAFGSPIQFSGKDSHPWITEMVACPVFRLPPGYWTDDGSMAMCVMDSYVRKGGYDLKDIGATFVRWLAEGYLSSKDGQAFDVGGATFSSCSAISMGSLVNGTEDSQGNGSIMRFAPSYLIARAENRPEVIHEVSDLTHASTAVRKVCDELAAVLDEHLAGKRTKSGPGKELKRALVPNSGWSVETLAAALWAFNTTESFEDGLVAAVNLGGDSDSIGAVYGQIAGAYYGFDAIPDRWVKAVKTWDVVDDLIERFMNLLPLGNLVNGQTSDPPFARVSSLASGVRKPSA